MKDQAEQLRHIVSGLQRTHKEKAKDGSRVITITSGKGGVGKTSFSTNLGICLSQMGYRTIIIDGDFGLANIDLMLGISSKHDLKDVITGRMSLKDIVTQGPEGLGIISGGSGIQELANIEPYILQSFLREIDQLNEIADIILIDTGAGITDNVVKMVLAAHEVIVIATPEPTAITDAYSLAKIISRVRRDINLNLIINKADSEQEAIDVMNKFERVAERFLGIHIKKFGFLYDDDRVSKSIKQQIPYVLSYPKSQVSKQVQGLARTLIGSETDNVYEHQGMASYIKRFLGIFNNKENYK